MKTTYAWLTCLAFISFAAARPVYVEESAALTTPDPTLSNFGFVVAIDGDWAMVAGAKAVPVDGSFDDRLAVVHLYRRVGGAWVHQREFARAQYDDFTNNFPALAMENGLASIFIGNRVYARSGDEWVLQPGGDNFAEGRDLELSGTRRLRATGSCSWSGIVTERDTAGAWSIHTPLHQAPTSSGCDDEHVGGFLDLDGNFAALADPYSDEESGAGEGPGVSVFSSPSPGVWQRQARIPDGNGFSSGEHVALSGDDLFVSGGSSSGTYLFRGGRSVGAWTLTQQLRPVNSFMGGGIGTSLEKSGELLLQAGQDPDRGVPVVNVFRKNPAGVYQHVAVLAAKNGAALGSSVDVSGRLVIVGAQPGQFQGPASDKTARIFELPASFETPPVMTNGFESTNQSSWQQAPGSQFAVTNVPSEPAGGINLLGGSPDNVFRQSSDVGDAIAVWTPTDRRDQAIEVDVRPRGYNGLDRWFGVMTRQTDLQNYYYVTMRSSNRIELKRKFAGVFTTLASAPFTVADRNYRLRLESIGTLHRVFVDGQLVLSASDAALPQGRAGLLTYRARADYDNVVVTSSQRATIYRTDFNDASESARDRSIWTKTGPGAWSLSGGVFAQTALTGDARAIVGTPTGDQALEVRMRATAFGPATGTQERWFGIMLRYVDDANYVYLSFRNNNRVALRELVNGQIRDHGFMAMPIPLTLGTWYAVRAHVLNGELRVWIDGIQRFALAGFGPPSGQVGLITYRTAAEFDDFVAHQP